MYSYQSACELITSLPRLHRNAVALICVEKMYPLISALAIPSTKNFTAEARAFLWESLLHHSENTTLAGNLIGNLKLVAEYGCDDSCPIAYLVSKPLDLLRLALESMRTIDPDPTQTAISLMLDFCEDFDVTIRMYPSDALAASIEPGLASREKASQSSIFSLLAKQEFMDETVIDALRLAATCLSENVARLVPIHSYRYLRDCYVCNHRELP